MTDKSQNWYAFDTVGHCVRLGNFGDYDAAFDCAEDTLDEHEYVFVMSADEILEIADKVRGHEDV